MFSGLVFLVAKWFLFFWNCVSLRQQQKQKKSQKSSNGFCFCLFFLPSVFCESLNHTNKKKPSAIRLSCCASSSFGKFEFWNPKQKQKKTDHIFGAQFIRKFRVDKRHPPRDPALIFFFVSSSSCSPSPPPFKDKNKINQKKRGWGGPVVDTKTC